MNLGWCMLVHYGVSLLVVFLVDIAILSSLVQKVVLVDDLRVLIGRFAPSLGLPSISSSMCGSPSGVVARELSINL